METPVTQLQQMFHSSLPSEIDYDAAFFVLFSGFENQYDKIKANPSGSEARSDTRSQSSDSNSQSNKTKSKSRRSHSSSRKGRPKGPYPAPPPGRRKSLSRTRDDSIRSMNSTLSSDSSGIPSKRMFNESFTNVLHNSTSMDNSARSSLTSNIAGSGNESAMTDTTHRSLNSFLEEKGHCNEPWEWGTFPSESNSVRVAEDVVEKIVSRWDEIMKMNIKEGELFSERFETIKEKRYYKTGVHEVKQTQPFVNGILRAFFKIYVEHGPQHHATDESKYNLKSSLYLFCDKKVDEGDHTMPTREEKMNLFEPCCGKGSPRIPDAAFIRRGTRVDGEKKIKFDCAALKCVLVSVEAKKNLTKKNILDAMLECQRDHLHASGKCPSREMRVGFSIITDGVDWYFLYIRWDGQGTGDQWTQNIYASGRIDFETSKTELAEWLCFVLQLSLTEPKLSTNFGERNLEGSSLSLGEVLHKGKRSIVSRWKNGEQNDFVLKRFYKRGIQAVDDKTLIYCMRECRFLHSLSSCQNIVNIHNYDETTIQKNWCFWLDYGGTPLEHLDISGKRGQQLASIVKQDIWGSALRALTEKEICHGDIHEKNILVCLDGNVATLIDFESAKKFGHSLAGSPKRHNVRYKFAKDVVDQIAVAALLERLWKPEENDFENLEDRMWVLKEALERNGKTELNNIVDEIPPAMPNQRGENNDDPMSE